MINMAWYLPILSNSICHATHPKVIFCFENHRPMRVLWCSTGMPLTSHERYSNTISNKNYRRLVSEESIPERTGWMLLRNIVAAKRNPSLEVSLIKSGLSVKNFGSCFRSIRTTIVKINPMTADVATAIITENFAAFGWFPPSSLETLTLKSTLFN